MKSRLNRLKNAKLVAGDREAMVRPAGPGSVACGAAEYGLSVRKVRKGKQRYATGGMEALANAGSGSKRWRCSLTSAEMARIHDLRQARGIGDERALLSVICHSTVFPVFRKLGLSRPASLEPTPAVRRLEWAGSEDMRHVEIKRLCRMDGIGQRKAGMLSAYVAD